MDGTCHRYIEYDKFPKTWRLFVFNILLTMFVLPTFQRIPETKIVVISIFVWMFETKIILITKIVQSNIKTLLFVLLIRCRFKKIKEPTKNSHALLIGEKNSPWKKNNRHEIIEISIIILLALFILLLRKKNSKNGKNK